MIELNNLTVILDGRAVLDRLTASVSDTQTTAVMGASGAGKTTLLRALAGLQKPDAGAITGMEGRRVAFVFQEDRLLQWKSALENVALVSDAEHAARWLTRLGLKDAMRLLPKELSGGMRRRVAVARALAYGGDLLLLDEPFGGLDAQSKAVTAEAILAAGLPIVLSTHDNEEANLLNTVSVIRL